MDILIVGAGKVGYFLAKTLSLQHNVTIIDKNEKALEKIIENLDVLTIKKDIRDSSIFHSLNNEYDFLINVTNVDEVNILSDLLIKQKLNIKHSIIRITNTLYTSSPIYKITNARLIFSYIICARAIANLMDFPKANNIKNMPFTELKLVSIRIKSPIITSAKEINSNKCVIIGVERDEEFIFLNEDDVLIDNDLAYIFGDLDEIKTISQKLDTKSPNSLENIIIFSANELGITIANLLYEMEKKIKIIEKDEELASKASEKLPDNIEILNLAYDDDEILKEYIQNADAAITAFLKDEENIIKSLKLKRGLEKIITINNNLSYHSIMHSLKLSPIRGPKIATFYEILEEIDSQFLVYERYFLGSKGKIFIKKIFTLKTIEPPKEKAKILIIRNEQIYILKEKFKLKENDIVIEFNFSGNKKWIENL